MSCSLKQGHSVGWCSPSQVPRDLPCDLMEHTWPSQLFGCPYCEVWTNMLCATTQGWGGEGGAVKLAISLYCIPSLTNSERDVLCTWVLDGGGHQAACWIKVIRLALVSVVLGVSVKVRRQQEVDLPVSWGSKPQAKPYYSHCTSLTEHKFKDTIITIQDSKCRALNPKCGMLLSVRPRSVALVAQLEGGSTYGLK